MLEVRNLRKNYGTQTAVENVSFSLSAGEKLILLGTSGSGKTTTLKMINRLIEPSAGQIWFDNQDARQQKPEHLRQQMGYVIQQTGLFPHFTVAQNIALLPKMQGWPRSKINARIDELLTTLGMPPEEFRSRFPDALSGGQKQRIGIARALAIDPPLLLMDEPFGALDPITRRQIQHDFSTIDSLARKTLVMVTHDVGEAFLMGQKICLMDKGRVQQYGTPKDLLFQPANDFVRDFFKSSRFQLELQVVMLEDLWDFFPSQAVQAEDDSENWPVFPATQDVWSVLETLTGAAKPYFLIRKNGDLFRAASGEALLPAFQAWKKQFGAI
ncbi:MAG: ABC transporter ATP-binding protein [Microscillaceae bacterium]